jgi:phage shock protein PspC (stress-responsive transcriptional regulator)
MKKTLTINLGGIVFHIDEDAYLLLNQYLENLKKHLSNLEERQEIYNDIELRISEILQEKLKETKQVITLEDVQEVIRIMGQPGQFDAEGGQQSEESDGSGGKRSKRFFRNPDEKVIAGVCSGIAAYFHLDPLWARLIFIITIFFGGTGVLLYLILWFVIPEAKTTSDKLEMRGEKINITNIEKSMREELDELRGRIGTMANGSASAIRHAGTRSASFFEVIGKGILSVLTFFWKILIIFIGIILMLLGLGFLIAILAFTFGWTGELMADNDVLILSFPMMAKLLLGCNMPVAYLQVIMLMILGIPSFMLFYNGSRMVFRFERIKYLGLTMFNIWVVGIVFLVFFSLNTYKLYKTGEEKQMDVTLQNPAADTLYLKLRAEDTGMKYLKNEKYTFVNDLRTIISDEGELLIVPNIRFEESRDSLFTVSQVLLARGKSQAEAQQHLAGIRYQIVTMGSSLMIGPYARLPKGDCWRGQTVNLIIRVPKGKFVSMESGLGELKPNWKYLMIPVKDLTMQMTEYGMEEVLPANDTITK